MPQIELNGTYKCTIARLEIANSDPGHGTFDGSYESDGRDYVVRGWYHWVGEGGQLPFAISFTANMRTASRERDISDSWAGAMDSAGELDMQGVRVSVHANDRKYDLSSLDRSVFKKQV